MEDYTPCRLARKARKWPKRGVFQPFLVFSREGPKKRYFSLFSRSIQHGKSPKWRFTSNFGHFTFFTVFGRFVGLPLQGSGFLSKNHEKIVVKITPGPGSTIGRFRPPGTISSGSATAGCQLESLSVIIQKNPIFRCKGPLPFRDLPGPNTEMAKKQCFSGHFGQIIGQNWSVFGCFRSKLWIITVF